MEAETVHEIMLKQYCCKNGTESHVSGIGKELSDYYSPHFLTVV